MQQRFKTRHLEAVITLAEEMHFGRAAERVGLSQSGLSRCIQSAEREANAKLFERDRRSMEITDAGRSYVEHARISLAHGERAIRSARETKDRAGHFLEIGKSPDVDPVLVEVLYSIRLPLYSDLEISIHSEPSSDLAHGLMSADLDVALITQPERNAKQTIQAGGDTASHRPATRTQPSIEERNQASRPSRRAVDHLPAAYASVALREDYETDAG